MFAYLDLWRLLTRTVAVDETLPSVASCGAVTPEVTATRVAVETCGCVMVAICWDLCPTVAAVDTAVWSVPWDCRL